MKINFAVSEKLYFCPVQKTEKLNVQLNKHCKLLVVAL